MSDKIFNMTVLETLIMCGEFKENHPDSIVTIN